MMSGWSPATAPDQLYSQVISAAGIDGQVTAALEAPSPAAPLALDVLVSPEEPTSLELIASLELLDSPDDAMGQVELPEPAEPF